MKIIHISDTHIDPSARPERSIGFNALLRRVCAEPFDHLVVTGDLTDAADRRGLAEFREILKSHGLLRTDLTTVVPGNHDIYGTANSLWRAMSFLRKCSSLDYDGQLRLFTGELGELFEGARSVVQGEMFPFIKFVGGTAVIGLNSSRRYSISKNLFAMAGEVTTDGLIRIGRILDEFGPGGGPRVVLSHHGLKDWGPSQENGWGGRQERLLALKTAGVRLVLHGHDHWMSEEPWDDILTVNAGRSGQRLGQLVPILPDEPRRAFQSHPPGDEDRGKPSAFGRFSGRPPAPDGLRRRMI